MPSDDVMVALQEEPSACYGPGLSGEF